MDQHRGRGAQPHILIIAHRGGVVTPQTPECSAGALRKAIEHGYDGVELDLQESQDGVPFVFHETTLNKVTGVEGTIASLPSDRIRQIRFVGTGESITPFATAAELAREKLALMLEIKGRSHGQKFYDDILRALERNNLRRYTFVYPSNPETREALGGKVRLKLNEGDVPRILPTLPDASQKYFAFGLPVLMKKLPMAELRAQGVPIIPGVNTFRYPAENLMELAKKDIEEMLRLGVDGFQIDSVYEEITRQAIRAARK